MGPYTLAVTSCNRHDLLERTLRSFAACADNPPRRTIVMEDGPTPEPSWFRGLKDLGEKIWMSNPRRMGQTYSVDRLWQSVNTELVFWCEDDWEFTDQAFINASEAILRDNPDILTVTARAKWNHPLVNDPQGRGFKIAEPYWLGAWGGMTFNPGLRRLSDYKKLGSFGKYVGYGNVGLSDEKFMSKMCLDMGFRIAALPDNHWRHIGDDRSRAIEQISAPPPLSRLPRILVAIPACWKFQYGRWESEKSPHYDAKHKAYGVDIHISGDNPRIQAVRDTWWNDLRPFRHHMVGRFFYGTPAPREPLADEIVLDTPDDYGSLPHKTLGIYRWALANDFDYVLKVDDDTYVWPARIVQEVLLNPPFDYAGYVTGRNGCAGGAGFFLSRRGMQVVLDHGNPTSWAEDVNTEQAMNAANMVPLALPGHVPGFAAHWFDIDKVTTECASIHAVKPEDMRTLYARENQ